MIKKNSIGAPNRRTVFVRGTHAKHCEVPKMTSRDTKADIFQEGNAGFKATIGLNKKMCVKVMSPRT
jgi:hypothetical protein